LFVFNALDKEAVGNVDLNTQTVAPLVAVTIWQISGVR
jgi:hypothetical protein